MPDELDHDSLARWSKRQFEESRASQALTPTEPPAELKEALDAFVNASCRLECCECETMPCEHADTYSAARAALVALFDRQREEIERLRKGQ